MGESIGFTKVSKARKPHSCWWCCEKIEKGQPYRRWAWAEDGRIDTVKTHPECNEAWNEASSEGFGPYECGPHEHERPKCYE